MSSVLKDSCVAKVRSKYAEKLKELLQCPVCLERATGRVRMCKVGHHLCETCWTSIRECPTCKTPFSPNDGRCFLAEELSNKWDKFLSVFAPQPIVLLEKTVGCRIGSCEVCLPSEMMREHIRNVHSSSLLKMKRLVSKRLVTLHLAYGFNRKYSCSLEAEGLGSFFFMVFIDQKGDAQMEIQVAHSCPGVEKFKYTMGIKYPNDLHSFCDGICAFRDEKGSHVYEVNKNHFQFYYKDEGTLDKEKKDLLTVLVLIRE